MAKKDINIPEIYIILGPTSSGKTSLALKLCEKFNGEIISADSRQICKYMDIGTFQKAWNKPRRRVHNYNNYVCFDDCHLQSFGKTYNGNRLGGTKYGYIF